MRLLREFTIAVPQEVSLLSLEDSRSPAALPAADLHLLATGGAAG